MARFKSDRQRKAMFARMNYAQLRSKGVFLSKRGDADRDGVRNHKDCRPLNPEEQGIIHDLVAGVGKAGGYVVGEATSGWKAIPKSFKRQKMVTVEREELKEATRDLKAMNKLKSLPSEEELERERSTLKTLKRVASAERRAKRTRELRKQLLSQLQKGDISFVKRQGKVVAVRSYAPPKKKPTDSSGWLPGRSLDE
jgi:hypothetical protein